MSHRRRHRGREVRRKLHEAWAERRYFGPSWHREHLSPRLAGLIGIVDSVGYARWMQAQIPSLLAIEHRVGLFLDTPDEIVFAVIKRADATNMVTAFLERPPKPVTEDEARAQWRRILESAPIRWPWAR